MPTVTAYRAGNLDSARGHFFANCFDSAWLYANATGMPVIAYEVSYQNARRLANQYVWLAERTGTTVEQVKQVKAKRNDPHWMRRIDEQILEETISLGFDAIIYERPTTPNAQWEIMVISVSQCSMLGECEPDGAIRSALEPSLPFPS